MKEETLSAYALLTADEPPAGATFVTSFQYVEGLLVKGSRGPGILDTHMDKYFQVVLPASTAWDLVLEINKQDIGWGVDILAGNVFIVSTNLENTNAEARDYAIRTCIQEGTPVNTFLRILFKAGWIDIPEHLQKHYS